MTRTLRLLFGMLVVAAVVTACASAPTATGSPAAGGSSGPGPSEAPSTAPSQAPSSSPEGGNGEPPAPGIVESELVEPQPGQQNVVSIPIEQFDATVDGRTVTLMVRWSSGVAPCSVLDQVLVNVGEETIDVTIREGTSDPNAMCVLMLQSKHTIVSFDVEPGSYTIRDTEGTAPPVEITVS
jgi:hypothetical protein